MSALRIASPRLEPCPDCGYRVRHVLLGHDEPVTKSPATIRLMRVPLEERLSRRAA